MDFRYQRFCVADRAFYDLPGAAPADAATWAAASGPLPDGWRTRPAGDWVGVLPPAVTLPGQGWKIHVSACLDNAENILDIVWKYCVDGGIFFKYVRGAETLKIRNSKYGDRSASGKFVTLYPLDDAHFERILTELGDLLDGQEGPYILSDLRWRSGPLYVRYGGFVAEMGPSETGDLVPCIRNPDGELVPDVRGPGFRPPEWVRLPDCLAEPLAARNAGTLEDFPYRVTKALHFSNGGGVYRATDTRSGDTVLLKEARPLAGLDGDGADAITRLRREHWALERLSGLSCMPELVEYRVGREHHFLAREFLDGQALTWEILRRNPFLTGEGAPERFAEYAAWALGILDEVERGVEAMHGRGVVFGDLHPHNILLRPDGGIGFIDLEAASEIEAEAGQSIGAPGYRAPSNYAGAAVDRYALGCLRLGIFVPLTLVIPWETRKVDQLIELVTGRFPLPAGFAERVWADLGPAPHPPGTRSARDEPLWPGDGTLGAVLGDGILNTATPDRADRLFPGDVEQFAPGGGVNFAHGAAGVLWALAEAGVALPDDHVDWLTAAVGRLPDPRPGFYDGLAGIAYALDRLGRPAEARELLERCASAPLDPANATLFDGLSGLGLTYLRFAQLDQADRIREHVLKLLAAKPGRPRPGLLRGATGPALFLLRLYEQTADSTLLGPIETALRGELADLGWRPGEPSSPEAPWRKVPLLGTGSGGLGMVLHDFVTHVPDPELCAARDDIRTAACLPFLNNSGLFHGRAGTALALRHLADGSPEVDMALRQHLTGFGWHAVSHEGNLLMLGDQALRLSTDLGTGSAGVLLAVRALLGESAAGLPFL
jgi:serine/threonine protein kinase